MYKHYEWKTVAELPASEQLPDPLIKQDGNRVASAEEWPEQREYLKAMLQHYLYGSLPSAPGNTTGRIISSEEIYDGKAVHEEVELKCGPDNKIVFTIHVVRPNTPGKYPVIVMNTFSVKSFSPEMLKAFNVTTSQIQADRPVSSPIEEEILCGRGYCFALFECTQLATDDSISKGQIYEAYPELNLKVIAAWSWGQMRVIDYLESVDYCDIGKIIATGHSRYGKVALCTGIYDERVALCAPVGSGCGGAGCFRILGGKDGPGSGCQESLGSLVTMFPHWFSDHIKSFSSSDGISVPELMQGLRNPENDGKPNTLSYNQYLSDRYPVKNEYKLPFDLHTAKALIAPRLLFTSDGLDDEWANPYGTKVTWAASGDVFAFLGVEENNAINFREGGHSFSVEDWTELIKFADNKLKGI